MSDIRMSKDAQKSVGVFYKSYLERRKSGIGKNDAKLFKSDWPQIFFPQETAEDMLDTLRELKKIFNLEVCIDGSFYLSDELIVYMENRFPDGVKDVLSFLAQFIP